MSKIKKYIGVCAARIQDREPERQIRSICEHARKSGYGVVIYSVFQKMDRIDNFSKGELSIFSSIRMEKLDALVILSESISNRAVTQKLINKAKRAGIPVVSVNQRYEGCYNVILDYSSSFERIVRHVVEEHGCKKINFVAGFKGNEFSNERIDIFKKVMAENNLEVEDERIAYGDFWEQPTRMVCKKWLDSDMELPDAIICANDIMAITVCNELINRGIKVPEQVIVTGFDGLPLGEFCTPELTTAMDDVERIGEYAIEAIEQFYNEKAAGLEHIYADEYVRFYVKYTESCGCKNIKRSNPNEQIMKWYGKAAETRAKTSRYFDMLTILNDGESVAEMFRRLRKFRRLFEVSAFYIFLNISFAVRTGVIPKKRYDKNEMVFIGCSDEKKVDFTAKVVKAYEHESQEGEILWVIPLHCQSEVYGKIYAKIDINKIDYGECYEFIICVGQALGNVRRQTQLQNMYITDALTSLNNRFGLSIYFENAVKKYKSEGKWMFLVSIDMDRLKYINDTFGHAAGDRAIVQLSNVISECCEENSIAARFGGDEFLYCKVYKSVENSDELKRRFTRRFNEKIQESNRHGNREYELSASCGIVVEQFKNMQDIEKIMKKADAAMYRCKEINHKKREN